MIQARAQGPGEPGREVQRGALPGPGGLSRQTNRTQGGGVDRSVSPAPHPAIRGPRVSQTGLRPAVRVGTSCGRLREHPFSLFPAGCPHAGTGDVLPQDSWQEWMGAAGFPTSELRLLSDSWEL